MVKLHGKGTTSQWKRNKSVEIRERVELLPAIPPISHSSSASVRPLSVRPNPVQVPQPLPRPHPLPPSLPPPPLVTSPLFHVTPSGRLASLGFQNVPAQAYSGNMYNTIFFQRMFHHSLQGLAALTQQDSLLLFFLYLHLLLFHLNLGHLMLYFLVVVSKNVMDALESLLERLMVLHLDLLMT